MYQGRLSLNKVPNAPYWMVSFIGADGGRSGAAQKHPIEAACTKARNWGEAQSAWEKGGAYRSYEKLYFMAKITENFENR